MKIYSPNKEYTGVSASVSFCNGKGETDDPRLIQWFKDHGYDVEEKADTEDNPEAEEKAEEDNPEAEEKPRKTGKKAVQKDGE